MNYRKLVTNFCNDYSKPVVHGWKNSESSSKPIGEVWRGGVFRVSDFLRGVIKTPLYKYSV